MIPTQFTSVATLYHLCNIRLLALAMSGLVYY